MPSGPVWIGDQLMAEDIGGDRFGLFAAADELHAALRGDVFDGSLAAAAGMDLGLDDRHRPGQFDERVGGRLGRVGHEAAGHRHARLAEDLLGLELVNFHGECFLDKWKGYYPLSWLEVQAGSEAGLANHHLGCLMVGAKVVSYCRIVGWICSIFRMQTTRKMGKGKWGHSNARRPCH